MFSPITFKYGCHYDIILLHQLKVLISWEIEKKALCSNSNTQKWMEISIKKASNFKAKNLNLNNLICKVYMGHSIKGTVYLVCIILVGRILNRKNIHLN